MLKKLIKDNKVCLMTKSLYGLCQAVRVWYEMLNDVLIEIGIVNTNANSYVYRTRRGKKVALIIVYMNDILVASSSSKLTERIRRPLSIYFEVKDLREVSSCVRM